MTTQDILGLHYAEAEIAVLDALRHGDDSSAEIYDLLEPIDFWDPRRACVYAAVRDVYRGVEPIDTKTIFTACSAHSDGLESNQTITPEYIESLSGNAKRATGYARTVKKLSWLRSASDFAFWLVQELQTHPDPENLYAEAQERWSQYRPQTDGADWLWGWDTIRATRDHIRQRVQEHQDGTAKVFSWPWQSWNRIRPLRGGMVGLFAAPDGMGKSAYLECIAEHWAQLGHQTVLVHLEDNHQYKLDRRLARHSKVSFAHIEDGALSEFEQKEIADANRRIAKWTNNLHYLHAPGRSMQDVVGELQRAIDAGACDCVVLDYIDKVQPTRGQARVYGNNAWERQANDMEILKSFAETAGIPVFTATQGNKSMQGDTDQTRKAIQGSGQKSQKSQLVCILTRDIVGESGLTDANGKHIADPGEYSPVCKVRVDKQNRGPTHNLTQFMLGDQFRIVDIETKRTELG